MPVYNEEAAIPAVLEKWTKVLDRTGIDYVIRPYNDGSKDSSLNVMRKFAAEKRTIDVRDKSNGGHGHTILTGYRDAISDGFDWIFQIDSDDEMGPDKFPELWAKRTNFDFLVGRRAGRQQTLPRKIISFISRMTVRLFYGKSAIWDVNSPYRLMRVRALKDVISTIPERTFAPNVIITGMAARLKLRAFEMSVPQHDRTTGEVSIKKWKLLKAAAKSLWQTVSFAYSGRQSRLLWPLIAFGCSMAASSVGGRSLWIDEIMRILCQQKYTISQLLDCKNLSDFDSQSPIGYILWRPVQSLLGIEFGGAILSALAAALMVWAILAAARKLKGSELSPWLCACVTFNPILIYYGGELWFYMPWGAALALACLSLQEMTDRSGIRQVKYCICVLVFGYLFVALHFAGIFIWFGTAVVFCLLIWVRKGFKKAFRYGILTAIPALVNLPLYLKAQFAAKHLDSAGINWSRLDGLADFIANYFIQIFPSFTGAWWLGSIALLLGVWALCRRQKKAEAVFLIGITLSAFPYLVYTYLRGYAFVVGRFWIFALFPVQILVIFGLDLLASRFRCGVIASMIVLSANFIGAAAVMSLHGRSEQTKWLIEMVERHSEVNSMLFINHYNTRQFNVWYKFKTGHELIFPAYWEQGEQARKLGTKQLITLSPLSAIYVGSPDERDIIKEAGCVSNNIFLESKGRMQRLAETLCLMPGRSTPLVEQPYKGVILPQIDELVAHAEKTGKPVFVPGKEWTLRQMPPQEQTKPFTPFLMLPAKAEGVLRVYVPKNFAADKLTLSGMVGSTKPGAATFGGRSVAYGKGMARAVMPISPVKKGEWNEIPVKAGETFAAFMLPAIN